MRRLLVLGVLVVLSGPAAAPGGSSGPLARVGAIYFDGWACPLSNFHFNGLLNTPFSGRRPLYGWRDNTVESMRTQLTWAHQDGIGFFLFDWYRENVDPCLDVALQNYKSLRDHHGVGFALLLVHNDVFAISPNDWPTFAERWVTEDFLNPDYERSTESRSLSSSIRRSSGRRWAAPRASTRHSPRSVRLRNVTDFRVSSSWAGATPRTATSSAFPTATRPTAARRVFASSTTTRSASTTRQARPFLGAARARTPS